MSPLRPWDRSLVVVRVGDAAAPADDRSIGSALPVFFDYYDFADDSRQRPWMSVAVRRTSDAGGNACTLSHGGTPTATSLTWFWDTEGLPSTAGDGSGVVLPCHTSPVGSRSDALLADAKTIAILRPNGSVDTSIRFIGFTGMRGTATGLRTAVTTNTREFWLAGIASSMYGVRYLANPRNTTTARVHGSLTRGDGSYQPATVDVRGLTLWSNQAYLTSAYVTEPNRNMPAVDDTNEGLTPWGGIVRLGPYGVLARNTTRDSRLLRGMDGRRNMHGFAFTGPQELFVLEDINRYERVRMTAAAAQLAAFAAPVSDEPGWPHAASSQALSISSSGTDVQRPMLARASLTTAIVRWAWAASPRGGDWKEDVPRKTYISDACYSLLVRKEAAGGTDLAAARTTTVVYTAGRTRIYRVVPETQAVTVFASAAGGTLFRGAVIAPVWNAAVTPTRTRTRTRTRTPSKSRSRTRSSKPRGMRAV